MYAQYVFNGQKTCKTTCMVLKCRANLSLRNNYRWKTCCNYIKESIYFGTLLKTMKTGKRVLIAALCIVEELSKVYFSLQMHLPDESRIWYLITYYYYYTLHYCCILCYECVCFRKLHVLMCRVLFCRQWYEFLSNSTKYALLVLSFLKLLKMKTYTV